jgi:hypothetical protein
MKLPPLKLRKAYSRRGADHGRPAYFPADRQAHVTLRLIKLRLDSGGYDAGGAYWGSRVRGYSLYWAESIDKFAMECRGVLSGTVELAVDARSRDDAKNAIRRMLPNAGFYR